MCDHLEYPENPLQIRITSILICLTLANTTIIVTNSKHIEQQNEMLSPS